MPSIDWITIKGFKSIKSISKMPLKNINVLIGPNGSGKSNFIGVFSLLNSVRNGRLQYYTRRAGGADKILHFGSDETDHISVHISFEDEMNQYSITLTPDQLDSMFPSKEFVYFWNRATHDEPYREFLSGSGREAKICESGLKRVSRYVQKHLERWKVYQFHDTGFSSPIKKNCDINDNSFLRPDGSNLAAFLYLLRKNHHNSYRKIRNTVHLVAPFIDDFILRPIALNEDKIRLEWKHKDREDYFDGSSLSDGSLRFIALTTLLLQPSDKRPSVILLDEPELGLHPYAITILASLVRSVAIKTQVILATQSSLLLDHFEPSEVIVASRADGATALTRLNESDLESWLQDYTLGQLWRKNEIGGRPSPEH